MNSQKTNVLLIMPSLKIRGAETMMVNIANNLDRQKFCVFVVSLSSENPLAAQLNSETVQFIPLPRIGRFDFRPANQIQKLIREYKISSLIALDIFSFLFTWVALWKVQPKPNVFISIHNIRYNHIKDLLKNIIIARLLSGKEVFVSVCNAQAEYWTKTYHIPRDRFHTIYNGVDTELFSPRGSDQKSTARLLLNLPKRAFVILQVASLVPEKCHADALTAFQMITQKNPSLIFRLIFVGDGPNKQSLQEMAQHLGLSDQVIFCGVQSDVKLYYSAADLFSLTSSTETFSVATLEAMSMGLPCVITNVGGACEMIVNGINGYLVEAHQPKKIAEGWQAVLESLQNFKSEDIRSGVIKHFSLSKCVCEYENLLLQQRRTA